MLSRVHRKNLRYFDDGCWDYCSKMYNSKTHNDTANYKHERKHIASTMKDTPDKTIDLMSWKRYYKWGMLNLF